MTEGEQALLGLEQAFVMTTAPAHKTFYYRQEHKRVIESRVLSERRLRGVVGPLIYVVTDCDGVLRYVGKCLCNAAVRALVSSRSGAPPV